MDLLRKIDFGNTEKAFIWKSDKELKRSVFIFSMLQRRWIVSAGAFVSNLFLKLHFPIKWVVKPTMFRQFCGGETVSESLNIIKRLSNNNVNSILDYSVESANEASFDSTLAQTVQTIELAEESESVPFSVFKPSAFCNGKILEKYSQNKDLNVSEAQEIDKFKGRVDLLCRSAHEKGVPILVDAEEYAYQDGVDRVVNEMMQKYNKERAIVYNTLQMYRWDRYGFLVAELEKANQKGYFLGIKLVRGAYMEKERALSEKYNYPSPINSTKEETDKEFNKAVKFVMNNLMNMSLFCGTHNEESIHMAIHLMNDLGIEKDDKRVFFSQLYGMSDNISFNLAAQGYNVAKYLPYGPVESVMPYLIRRAQENTAVAGQMSRELMLLKKEKQRRKNSKNGSR